MDLSFLATQKATPKRSGWLRYFFVALALYPPVYVHAATVTETPGESGTTITVNTGTIDAGTVDADGTVKFWFNEDGVSDQGFELSGGYINAGEGNDNETYLKNNGRVNAYMLFGYAYDANYTGGNERNYNASTLTGNVSLVKKDGATLVMATENSFTGGVQVQNGALYLGHAKAAGSGVITLNNSTAAAWDLWLNSDVTGDEEDGKLTSVTDQQFTKRARQGAELMVNCPGSPNITNSILLSNLSEAGKAGQAHISFGYATYGDLGNAGQLPCAAPGRVTLSGGVFGSGELVLHGYSYSDKPDTNYVSTFAINKDNAPATAPGTDFSGTVVLKNAFNETPLPDRAYHFDRLLGGAVQLNLKDNVFANATINLTRDSSDKAVGWEGYYKGWWGKCASMRVNVSQTSDNILVLDGSVELNALKAGFLGSMWWHEEVPAGQRPGNSVHGGYTATWYIEDCSQAMERWRVRVVTSGENNTLTLDDDTENAVHVFDGAIGFAQAYVEDGQTKINEFAVELDPVNDPIINQDYKEYPDHPLSTPPKKNDASFAPGGGTLGQAGVNLVKSGQATQYIHTAMVKNLDLKGGTLGFNHLTLTGNLTMTGGTRLELGVTEFKVEAKEWDNITGTYYDTNNDLEFKEGQTLSVAPSFTVTEEGTIVVDAVTSAIDGSITIGSGATLDFNFLGSDPTKYGKDVPLLSITGDLTLAQGSNVSVDFPGLEYFINTDKYYLAQVTGSLDANIANPSITLGHGYTGTFGIEDKYLILTIKGQATRTWTGAVTGNNTWSASGDTNVVGLWKENAVYKNGLTVLFGNTIEATAPSTPNVVKPNIDPANLHEDTSVTVDGEGITAQQVQISGEVTPGMVIINPSYYVGDTEGTPVIDNTNYYFTGSDNDVTGSDKDAIAGTASVLKQGEGTAVFNLANTYTGGTTIEGGRLVMQNKGALGLGGVIIQNGATLQGDFDEMYITNAITVNHNIGNTKAHDAVLRGRKDKTLTIADLDGAADTTLLLQGNASTDKYGVFEVVDASGFYGTVQLAGYLNGEGTNGNVQLQITSSTSGSNWTNATIDLSTTNANRTVLALGTSAQLSSLKGTGANSSVVNMSEDQDITLTLLGTKADSYEGALGYGDFQMTGGYVGYYRGDKHTGGAFHVVKEGSATQTVGSAWLDSLTINNGTFAVTKDLVVDKLDIEHGKHLYVGTPGDVSYGLNVGKGGILAIGASYDGNGNKIDAFAGVGAGVAARVESVGTGEDGVSADNPVGHTNFILFSDGATITAVDDWYTKSPESTVEITGSSWYDKNGNPVAGPDGANHITHTFTATRDIKIADGASVTFNTRHYSPYDKHTDNSSHVMQMLGNMSGNNVHLTFNNEQIGKGAEPAEEMGYVAIKDIHQFTGNSDITVKANTVLQVTENNTTAATSADKMSVTVDGANAAIQFTSQDASGADKDGISQYVDNVTLKNGGHLLVGGALVSNNGKNTSLYTKDSDGNPQCFDSDVSVGITNTEGKEAILQNLIVSTSAPATRAASADEWITSVGGTEAEAFIATGATLKVHNDVAAKVHHAKLHDSIVQLHKGASVDLIDSVLVDYNSSIQGVDNSPNSTPGNVTVGTGTTVQMSFESLEFEKQSKYEGSTAVGGIGYLTTTSFVNVDVTGDGLTLQLAADIFAMAKEKGLSIIGIQVDGQGGKFALTESAGDWMMDPSKYVITLEGSGFSGAWVTTGFVKEFVGNDTFAGADSGFIWLSVPEPTTATLSLLALTALAARRRRRK